MDQDDIIRGTIFTRRQVLRTILQTGAGLALFSLIPKTARGVTASATRPSLPLIAAPQVTEGPFFVDEKLNRSDLIGDTKRETVTGGLPLLLTFTVYKMTGGNVSPMKDGEWHGDAASFRWAFKRGEWHGDAASFRWAFKRVGSQRLDSRPV